MKKEQFSAIINMKKASEDGVALILKRGEEEKMKKFLAGVLAFVLMTSSIILSACGGKNNLSIDGEFAFPDAELGENYKPDLSGIEILGGKSDLEVKIKDNTVTCPDGTTIRLIAGQFKAEQLGNYSVTLTTSDDSVPEVSKTITCKDTTDPVLSIRDASELPATALIGETITLPAFQATDAGKLVGSPVVTVVDPDQNPVTVTDNTFVTAKAGTYKITATQSDNSGNEGSLSRTLTVYNAEFDPSVAVYFSSEYGSQQGNPWSEGHAGYFTETYVPDVTADGIPAAPNGLNSATRLTANEVDNNRMMYRVDFSQTDLSGYDYIGMWVYNDSDMPNNMYSAYSYSANATGAGVNSIMLAANSWTYLSFNLSLIDSFGGTSDLKQPLEETTSFAFQFQQVKEDGGQNSDNYISGDSVYMTDFVLGNFTDGMLAEFDKEYGTAFFTQFMADRANYFVRYSTDEATKQESAEGSLELVLRKAISSFNVKLYGFNGVDETSNGKQFKLWAFNPNDYDVDFNDGNGNVTTIKANSEGYAIVRISATNRAECAYGAFSSTVSRTDGQAFAAGATALCLGSMSNEEVAESTTGVLSQYNSIGQEAYLNGYLSATRVDKSEASAEDKFYGEETFSAKYELTGATGQLRIWMDMNETDWTEYDYVKFYVYNDTSAGFKINEASLDDNTLLAMPVAGVGVWTPVVIPLTEGAKIPNNKAGFDSNTLVMQSLDSVQTLGLRIRVADNDNNWNGTQSFAVGDKIYFSAIMGGKYTEAEANELISLEDGINAFRVARGRMVDHYAVTEEITTHTQSGQEGTMMKVVSAKDFPVAETTLVVTLNGAFYREPGYKGEVSVYVYNDSDTAVTISNNTVEANSGKEITLSATAKEIVLQISGLETTGNAIYFGNVYKKVA